MGQCIVEGCTKPQRGLGLCAAHHTQFLRYGKILPRPLKTYTRYHGALCAADGCTRRATDRGYCGAHYWRVRTHGDPLAHIPIKPQHRAERREWNN